MGTGPFMLTDWVDGSSITHTRNPDYWGFDKKNEQPPALFFNLPGLGRLMLTALNSRDYPVISGINLFFAAMVVAINLVIDLI